MHRECLFADLGKTVVGLGGGGGGGVEGYRDSNLWTPIEISSLLPLTPWYLLCG